MKNVMKKVFSLLLVGVVAVSMFGFIAPTRAEATENGKGVVGVYNFFDGDVNLNICFQTDEDELVEVFNGTLLCYKDCSFFIPDNTKSVKVFVENNVGAMDLDFEVNEKASSSDYINVALINYFSDLEDSATLRYTSGFSRIK